MKHFCIVFSRLQFINLSAIFPFHVYEIMQASFFFVVILSYALYVIDTSAFPRQLTEPLEDKDMFYFPASML